jgi:Subtilase family
VRYRVDQDGIRRASGDASNGIPPVRLSPGPATVRFTLSARRTGPRFTLSPASTTTWQWHSQRDPSATVPPPWACLTGTRAHLALTQRCAVQPMLTLACQIGRLAPDGSAPPGRQQITLSTGRIQLAATPAIQAAGLLVSFDGGETWTPAQVTPGTTAGQFTATFTAPAGTFVTLRTTAADAAGVGTGWDLEATLDVSMISAACPRCRILVVEGNSDTTANLAATERTAARLGAQVISNSYGAFEDGFSLPFRRAYQPHDRTVVASSGDSGFTDAQFPADLPTVTSVGGTMLTRARNPRGWRERVWRQSNGGAGGSGCSASIAKPPWQHDTHCPGRTIADISAVADSIPIFNPSYSGWVTVAGTSASAPLIAGIYGLAGNATTMTTARLYRHRGSFFDITTGWNTVVPPRIACGGDYLCTARKGYDAPTGLGTPNGPAGL